LIASPNNLYTCSGLVVNDQRHDTEHLSHLGFRKVPLLARCVTTSRQ